MVGDHLLEHVVADAPDRNNPAINRQGGRLRDVEVLGKLHTRFNCSLCLRSLGACSHFVRVLPRFGDRAVQGKRGSLIGGQSSLTVEDRCRKIEEGLVSAKFGDTEAISCRVKRLGMLRQREHLKDEVRIRILSDQLLNGRLRVLAMRTLEVGELYNFKVLARRAMGGSIRSLNQGLAILSVRMIAEWQDLVAGNDVLSVSKRKKLQCASLLTALFSD